MKNTTDSEDRFLWTFYIILWIVVVSLFVVFFSPKAEAANGETDLIVHMTSNHFGRPGFNEKNYGLGVKMTTNKNWSVTFGGLINSIDTTTLYYGIGKVKRFNSYLAAGIYGGVISYPSPWISGPGVYPAILPIVTVGKGRFKLDMTIVPVETDTIKPAVLFSLNVKIK